MTLITINLSSRASLDRYPEARQKADALGSIFVSALLGSGAIAMASHSIEAMITAWQQPDLVISTALTSPVALYMAIATIVIKELLFHATMYEARRIGSAVLVASAWHHRSDSWSTGVATLGIAGTALLHSQSAVHITSLKLTTRIQCLYLTLWQGTR